MKDEDFVKTMDMMVRVQLVKEIDTSIKDIVNYWDGVKNLKDIPLKDLHDMSSTFEKTAELLEKTYWKEISNDLPM